MQCSSADALSHLFSADIVGTASLTLGMLLALYRYVHHGHPFWSRRTSANFVDGASIFPLLVTMIVMLLPVVTCHGGQHTKFLSPDMKHVIAIACVAAIFAVLDEGEPDNGQHGRSGDLRQ